MGKPVEITWNSKDHAEFCDDCEYLRDAGWMKCGKARSASYQGNLCSMMKSCPAGKWVRVYD